MRVSIVFMKVLGVSYPIISSIRVSARSTVCEYQECRCEFISTRVVQFPGGTRRYPCEYSECSLLVLSVPLVSPSLAKIEQTEYQQSECPLLALGVPQCEYYVVRVTPCEHTEYRMSALTQSHPV